MCFSMLVTHQNKYFFKILQNIIKTMIYNVLWSKTFVIIWHFYKVHFLKVYLSMLRNTVLKVSVLKMAFYFIIIILFANIQ